MRFISYVAAALPVFSVALAGTTPEEVQADLVDMAKRANTIGAFCKLTTEDNAEDMGARILKAIGRLRDVISHARTRLAASDSYDEGDDADNIMAQYSRFSDKMINGTHYCRHAHDALHEVNEEEIGEGFENIYNSLIMYNRELYCVISKAASVDVVRTSTNAELAVAAAAQDFAHPPELLDIGKISDGLAKKQQSRDHPRGRLFRFEM